MHGMVRRNSARATTADRGQGMDLRNETAINVAGLLQEPTGKARDYDLSLDRVHLDADEEACKVRGEVRLTRLRDGVMARVRVTGLVSLACVRCLRRYDQSFATTFSEEYRQTVDVRTGLGVMTNTEGDVEVSIIDENHEIDLTEVLRQEILVSLPMRPDCGEACPGPDMVETGGDEQKETAVDDRLAPLAQLLADDEPVNRS